MGLELGFAVSEEALTMLTTRKAMLQLPGMVVEGAAENKAGLTMRRDAKRGAQTVKPLCAVIERREMRCGERRESVVGLVRRDVR